MMIKKIINLKEAFLTAFLAFITLCTFAQGGLVEGTVMNTNGDTLKNVKVSLQENLKNVVYTNEAGYFFFFFQNGQHLIIECCNMA